MIDSMRWIRALQGFSGLSTLLGCVAVWYAFQRQMCTGTGECAPNVVYLIPGLLAILMGVAIVVLTYRRRHSDNPAQV